MIAQMNVSWLVEFENLWWLSEEPINSLFLALGYNKMLLARYMSVFWHLSFVQRVCIDTEDVFYKEERSVRGSAVQLRVKEQIWLFTWGQTLSDLIALLNSNWNEQMGESSNLVVRSGGNKHSMLLFALKMWVLIYEARCLNKNMQ